MSIGITIDVRDAAVRQRIDLFLQRLTDRTELHGAIGDRAQKLTRSHLVAIAQSRHATAERLGAAPSGHWAQAAEKTTFTANAQSATVSIRQPGIGRVAHDVTIAPGAGKTYLTIPAIAAAYNRRAPTVPDLTMMIRWKDGRRRAVALAKVEGKGKARTETVWYWLVKSVRQKQDRTLLPSDDEYLLSALAGVRDYIDYVLGQG